MTDIVIQSITVLGLLFMLLSLGVWISLSLLCLGFIIMAIYTDTPVIMIMTTTLWGNSASWSLTALPLFIWMGDILVRTRLPQDTFKGLALWVRWLPGRLVHTNIISSGMLAAITGSSAVTAMMVGRITIPELQKRNYNKNIVLGTLAGSATLGLLIPPSIIMIVYGVSANVSISRLFLAGVLPGILLMLLFMLYTALWSIYKHQEHYEEDKEHQSMSLDQKIRHLKNLIPLPILIVIVIGSIYSGIATPTESATIGVMASFLLAFFYGDFSWSLCKDSLRDATIYSCIIMFIIIAASFLTVAMGFIGLPATLAQTITDMNLSVPLFLTALTVLFVILGCVLDGISIILLTNAIMLPTITALGIDLLWFGVFLIVVVEMSQITPPIGLNLFVINAITKDNIFTIAKSAFPFFLIMILLLIIITLFPKIVTWIPSLMTIN